MTRAGRFAERSALSLPGILPDAPNPARVGGGRVGLLACFRWEGELEQHHRRALIAGVAALWQTGRPTVGLKPDGAPRYGVASPDYFGLFLDGSGRAIGVEAKTTADARLPRSAFDEHQCNDLDAIDGAGGLALAAIELRGRGRWVISWRAIRWCGPRGGASVGVAELAGWEMLDGPDGYLARWCRR
jgi:hypothetical protein